MKFYPPKTMLNPMLNPDHPRYPELAIRGRRGPGSWLTWVAAVGGALAVTAAYYWFIVHAHTTA